MKKESILYGIIGLLIGIVLMGFTANYAVNNNHNGLMNMMGMNTNQKGKEVMENNDMSMSEMATLLQGKTGDEFDKAFIAEMIVHHQGAIDMAKLAKSNAKHDEVKGLADDILAAQSKEIDMMQTWQTQWGYKTTPSTESHDMMEMSH
ncbi:hypothetical protein BH10PAT3_BH10PAT3_0670 [soil metagenome]